MTELSLHTDPDARENGKCGWTKTDSGNPCQYAAGRGRDQDTGLCSEHHSSWLKNNDNATGNSGGGAPEGNQNATQHGAYRTLSSNFLSEKEGERQAFDDAMSLLESPEGAQEVARTAAATCLIRYNRGGDPRFLRRFEGICDKFGIAPAEELAINHDHEHRHAHAHADLSEDERSHIDAITGGPQDIDVEAVGELPDSDTDVDEPGTEDETSSEQPTVGF